MKKKVLIGLMLSAVMAVPVFAATTDSNNGQADCCKQMVQQAVKDGTISAEEAAKLKENMEQMAPIMKKIMEKGNMMDHGMMMGNDKMMMNCMNNNKDNNDNSNHDMMHMHNHQE